MQKKNVFGLIAFLLISWNFTACKNNDNAKLEFVIENNTATLSRVTSKEVKKIVIPSTYNGYPVTKIGEEAFSECKILSSVEIPEGVTSIGNKAFIYCQSLYNINIPNSVTSIGEQSFAYCYSLASFVLPENLTSLGKSAFYANYQLVEIYNLSKLPISDFYDSYVSLFSKVVHTSKEEPSVVHIKDDFQYAKINSSYYLLSYLGDKKDINLPSTIEDSKYEINSRAFLNKSKLVSVKITDGVTSLGSWSFSGCDGLTSVTISDSVESIDFSSFSNCYNLKKINIPTSLSYIDDCVFSNCRSLTSITIPENIESIKENSFSNCYRLHEVYNLSTLDITVHSEDNGFVAYYADVVHTSSEDSSIIYKDKNFEFVKLDSVVKVIDYIGNNKNAIIPSQVKEISNNAFFKKDKIVSVTIPNSVTSIGHFAFYGCENLKEIKFAGSMKEWDLLKKDSSWIDVEHYTVICNDGEIKV